MMSGWTLSCSRTVKLPTTAPLPQGHLRQQPLDAHTMAPCAAAYRHTSFPLLRSWLHHHLPGHWWQGSKIVDSMMKPRWNTAQDTGWWIKFVDGMMKPRWRGCTDGEGATPATGWQWPAVIEVVAVVLISSLSSSSPPTWHSLLLPWAPTRARRVLL
jgi:hypothetical protein